MAVSGGRANRVAVPLLFDYSQLKQFVNGGCLGMADRPGRS
jgi:hypothetical protein